MPINLRLGGLSYHRLSSARVSVTRLPDNEACNEVHEFLTVGTLIKAEDASSLIPNIIFSRFEKDLGGDRLMTPC